MPKIDVKNIDLKNFESIQTFVYEFDRFKTKPENSGKSDIQLIELMVAEYSQKTGASVNKTRELFLTRRNQLKKMGFARIPSQSDFDSVLAEDAYEFSRESFEKDWEFEQKKRAFEGSSKEYNEGKTQALKGFWGKFGTIALSVLGAVGLIVATIASFGAIAGLGVVGLAASTVAASVGVGVVGVAGYSFAASAIEKFDDMQKRGHEKMSLVEDEYIRTAREYSQAKKAFEKASQIEKVFQTAMSQTTQNSAQNLENEVNSLGLNKQKKQIEKFFQQIGDSISQSQRKSAQRKKECNSAREQKKKEKEERKNALRESDRTKKEIERTERAIRKSYRKRRYSGNDTDCTEPIINAADTVVLSFLGRRINDDDLLPLKLRIYYQHFYLPGFEFKSSGFVDKTKEFTESFIEIINDPEKLKKLIEEMNEKTMPEFFSLLLNPPEPDKPRGGRCVNRGRGLRWGEKPSTERKQKNAKNRKVCVTRE